ncbi:MAG: hypothetical protein AAFX94_24425 [Myxococcota bacterium]
MKTHDLLQFADALGITRSYTALDATEIPTSVDVARRFVEAMGHGATDEDFASLMRRRWSPGVEAVSVVRPGEPGAAIWTVPHRDTESVVEWRLVREDGERLSGQIRGGECPVVERGLYDDRRSLPLPPLPAGYHRLHVADTECLLICAPEQAYRPDAL